MSVSKLETLTLESGIRSVADGFWLVWIRLWNKEDGSVIINMEKPGFKTEAEAVSAEEEAREAVVTSFELDLSEES